jgi:hypothetical protein
MPRQRRLGALGPVKRQEGPRHGDVLELAQVTEVVLHRETTLAYPGECFTHLAPQEQMPQDRSLLWSTLG